MDRPLHDSAYSWFRLAVTLAVAVIGNVGMWVIVLVLPAIEAEFAVDRADATLPYTLTMIGFALGNLLIGRAVDRWGVTASLIGAALVLGAGYMLAAMAGSVAMLAAVQLLVGLGTGVAFGPLIADVSHWFLRRRGIAVAIAASGNYLSGAVWPLILSPVLAAQGWRAVYHVLALASVAGIVPLALLLRRRMTEEGAAHAARQRPVVATGLPPRLLVALLALAGVGCCVAMSMPQVHIVALCIDLGFGAEAGARMLSLMLMGGVASRLVAGMLSDRLGGVRTLLISSTMQGLALFLYLPFDGLDSLSAVSLVFGLSQGGIVPAYAVIVREYLPARDAGTQVGVVMAATIVGMALGGWLAGWIFDMTGSYDLAILNGIAWNVMNIGIILLILNRTRPRTMVPA